MVFSRSQNPGKRYVDFYLENIFKFCANRFLPYIGLTFAGILLAHKNIDEFSFFSYISSAFIFPATIATFIFYAIGNLPPPSSTEHRQRVFNSSFAAAITLSGISCLVCTGILYASSAQLAAYASDYQTSRLSWFYIAYTFFYIINGFFNSYFEAWLKDKTSTTGRTLGFTFLVVVSSFGYFQWESLNYSTKLAELMLGCAVFESAYYLSRCLRLGLLSKSFEYKIISDLLRIGAPMGIGLAFQRLAILLVNARLLLIDKDFVSLYSIAMSIVSLLLIPASAFAQIHTIYVTRNKAIKLGFHPIVLLAINLAPAVFLIMYFGDAILPFYGLPPGLAGQVSEASHGTALILGSTAPLMLITAHLRAKGSSLRPQILINISVYCIYIPIIFSGALDNRPPTSLLFAYAITFLICMVSLLWVERKSLFNLR
ncbi:hypothetical protein [Pseudomonas japonica]|uniref:hypothetical protein n=1 Tax=Pseudomonas japonica TaxID=256466 RepID=UPI0015E37AE9|nr:hypothetical protein [Pseudomonas japonica]MBA1244863.1 hypothetical protein [Pseudomonas japonica]